MTDYRDTFKVGDLVTMTGDVPTFSNYSGHLGTVRHDGEQVFRVTGVHQNHLDVEEVDHPDPHGAITARRIP